MAFGKLADQDLHCFQNRIYLGSTLLGLINKSYDSLMNYSENFKNNYNC